MRRSKRVVAACLILVMGVHATGCHSWRAVTEPVPAAVARYPNRKIQVINLGGGTTTANSARVAADAILAFHGQVDLVRVVDEQGNVAISYRLPTDTIPLAEIPALKVRLPSTGRSIVMAVPLVAVGLFAVKALVCSGGGSAPLTGWRLTC